MTDPRIPDLRELRQRYEAGENVTAILKNARGGNDEGAIEIAYDLQAGTYVAGVLADRAGWAAYTAELGAILARHVRPLDTVLDCGTGEMTTLLGMAAHLPEACEILAFDISLSRLAAGLDFADRYAAGFRSGLRAFCAPMSAIPLADRSVDVVLTVHALEPNHGREAELLAELFRVARRKAVLFEPSYERAGPEGRRRMEGLGYVRDLTGHVGRCGGTVTDCVRIERPQNPLNPTYAWIVDVPGGAGDAPGAPADLRCPLTGGVLRPRDGFLWSAEGLYAYPTFRGVPILKAAQAVVMTRG